jgi:hypothetical protein
MKFGRGRPADADGPGSEGGGTLPIDFMYDPAWTVLVAPLLRGEANPRSLTRLPRKDRDYIYRAVSHIESPISVERTRAWYQEAPSANTAALVGAAKVRDARRIRMGRRLFDMTPSESQRYTVILADAESFLLNACSHYPDSVLPWIPRIDLARGLSLGPDEILRRFAEAQARERWNFLAAEATFTGLLPSWSGSYELLFRLGTDAMADTPRGHAARSLVATAEAERIMNDRNLNLSHMPARSGLDFTRLFVHHVRALPDELDPDDVIGLGAFMFVAIPRNKEEAEAVLLGLELLHGRCGGQPYDTLNNPLAWFGRTLASRESEARALLVA